MCDILGWGTASVHLESSFGVPSPAPLLPCAWPGRGWAVGWCVPALLLGVSAAVCPGPRDAGRLQSRNRSVQGGASLCWWVSGLSSGATALLVTSGWARLLGALMPVSSSFLISRVDLASATSPAPCSKSLRLPKPPMALLHTGQTKSETGEGGENERRGEGQKKKEKRKRS